MCFDRYGTAPGVFRTDGFLERFGRRYFACLKHLHHVLLNHIPNHHGLVLSVATRTASSTASSTARPTATRTASPTALRTAPSTARLTATLTASPTAARTVMSTAVASP